ncbi:MAG TPA: ATP-dependent DNA helicase RecG [Acidimicrobiia bacterium]|nr:ATP-dependent DNA helicase RecG [Acidimicrobiia bacterium]
MGASPDRAGLTLRELASHRVDELRAVGDKLRAGLADMGIETVLDLLEHYPRRYVDRTERAEIHELEIGQEATVDAEVRAIHARRTRDRKRSIVNATVYDGTGLLEIVFFNQAWRERQLRPGTQVSLFGKVESYRGKRQMTNPVVDVLADPGVASDATSPASGSDVTGSIVPVYPQSGKAEVHTWQLRRAVASCLQRTAARGFADPLDAALRAEHELVDRGRAYNDIHRPATMTDKVAAAQRLKFDEFLRMQLALVARKRALAAEATGIVHAVDGDLVPAFHAALPFPLTDDQVAAIAQIVDDMAKPAPMHRLLQGEVGSGKTVVALTALLTAVQGGYQGAFMAPTEVLAEQHELTMRALLGELSVMDEGSLLGERPVGVALLTNRTSAAERRRIADGLRAGTIDILVGTHALIYGGVEFANLGVAVIDEQHRFGVEQRDLLRGKGDSPDVLVMTATPIPRTAAMLIYGDLDKTELRHLPAGRSPIETTVVGGGPLERVAVYDLVRAQVAEGRQAYVVCPLVEGSDKLEARAATEEFERLEHEELAGLRLGLLHGQMPASDKEAAMRAFRAHDTDVLVATTVIEVGVDVPNATVMVIEDADRFGLLQLHQLRGRIGRGTHKSYCYLLAEPTTPQGEARMEAMTQSGDGFDLAERDLAIRGAGEVFGERQAGWTDLKLGRLPQDEPIVFEARGVAEAILDDDPDLEHHGQLREEVTDLLGENVDYLFKS